LFSTTHGQSGGSALGKEIVMNAMDLRQRLVREVMQPRRDIVALSTGLSLTECMDVAEKTRYSRFPICQDGDLDRTLGVVHIKDLYAMRLKAREASELLPVARKIVYVPESARLERLLQLLLERRLHLAVVVDEYGSTVGMATLEDILEELVGQIQDEFDQEKPPVRQLDDRSWEVDGSLPLHELAELVEEPLHEEGITTTSGWMTHRLGGFPKTADEVRIGRYRLHVEEVDGLRVARLRVTRHTDKEKSPDEKTL
jgi:CBS domain containing-hemolysin-like protein